MNPSFMVQETGGGGDWGSLLPETPPWCPALRKPEQRILRLGIKLSQLHSLLFPLSNLQPWTGSAAFICQVFSGMGWSPGFLSSDLVLAAFPFSKEPCEASQAGDRILGTENQEVPTGYPKVTAPLENFLAD